MKIVVSADCFYPAQIGGPSTALYWQTKALKYAGYDVTIVATSQFLPDYIETDKWLTMDCGRVIYTQNPHFYLPLKHIWQGWRAIRKADLIHVNSLFYPASLAWVLLARLVNKPIVWSPRGELSPAALRYGSRLKPFVIAIVRTLRSSIWFHATCANEATYIQQQIGLDARVHIIPNSMELPQQISRRPNERPYLLFIGRLHPIKAIDQLLDALAQSVTFRKSGFRLLIAGPTDDEAYEQQLRRQIKSLGLSVNVSLIGPVYEQAKQHLYAHAHITILPSHSENFGNVVIESLAQETPVIASTGTPWQQLETENAGRWISNDPNSLRRAIDTFLTMPFDTYHHFRKCARLLALQYDSTTNVSQWTYFYNQAITTHESAKRNRFS